MPHNRFFVHQPLKNQKSITIQDTELKHLHVMRVETEETIELINGKGFLATAKMVQKDRKKAELEILNLKEEKQTQRSILALGLIKIPLLEWVLEKATELGITDFWIFHAEKSMSIRISASKQERFQQILISSIKQCGRLFLPKIEFFDSLQKLPSFSGEKFYGDIAGTDSFKTTKDSALIAIGPESGFSEKEESFLKKNYYKGISLHKNILRAETAAIIGSYQLSQ